MSQAAFIALVSAAILVVLVLRAIWVWRAERGAPRGSLPGTGDHVIDASYHSGLGGHQAEFRVPKDPQVYARRFVPRR